MWNFQAHREFPGKFESSNLSRDNASREIGRIVDCYFDVGKGRPHAKGLSTTLHIDVLKY